MSAALMAALAATAGIVIGRLWDVRSEAARWRRDQTAASYQRLVDVFRRTLEGIRTVALADPASDSFGEYVDRVRADSSWDDAYSAVWLHGSPAVIEVATSLDLAVTELFYQAQDQRHRVEDWYRIRIPARQAFEEFIEAVRADLGRPTVHVRFFPDFARQIPSVAPDDNVGSPEGH